MNSIIGRCLFALLGLGLLFTGIQMFINYFKASKEDKHEVMNENLIAKLGRWIFPEGFPQKKASLQNILFAPLGILLGLYFLFAAFYVR